MAKSGQVLTARQQRAIDALLTSKDVKAAAAAAGVGYKTLRRWLELPPFRAALREAVTALTDQTIRRLADLASTAVETLSTAMTSADKDSVKVSAANAVLTHLYDLSTARTLEGEIDALSVKIEEMTSEKVRRPRTPTP